MALRSVSLFSGIGGLDLGLQLVADLRTVCYVEREAFAAATLVARMEDEDLDSAPVWDDITTFDGKPWCGSVDLVVGGFPCQDVSNAGKRAGLCGARSGLWFEFARIIREVGPRYVFVENVASLANRGLAEVLGSLADLGFDAEWDVFTAEEVGAPHLRKRMFIFAWRPEVADDLLLLLLRDEPRRSRRESGSGEGVASDARGQVAHHHRFGRERLGSGRVLDEAPALRNDADGRCGEEVAHHHHLGLEVGTGLPEDAGAQQPSVERDRPRYPPGPEERQRWEEVIAKHPDLEPAVCRVAHGLPDRVDRLRSLGNGVVPDVAARAWSVLVRRAASDKESGRNLKNAQTP